MRHSRVWFLSPHFAVLFHIKTESPTLTRSSHALYKETENWVRARREPNPERKWCTRNLLFSAVGARVCSARTDGAREQSQGSRSGKTLPQKPTSCRLTQDQIASGGFRSPTKLSIPVWHLRLWRVGRESSLSGYNFPNAHLFCTFSVLLTGLRNRKCFFVLKLWPFHWLSIMGNKPTGPHANTHKAVLYVLLHFVNKKKKMKVIHLFSVTAVSCLGSQLILSLSW